MRDSDTGFDAGARFGNYSRSAAYGAIRVVFGAVAFSACISFFLAIGSIPFFLREDGWPLGAMKASSMVGIFVALGFLTNYLQRFLEFPIPAVPAKRPTELKKRHTARKRGAANEYMSLHEDIRLAYEVFGVSPLLAAYYHKIGVGPDDGLRWALLEEYDVAEDDSVLLEWIEEEVARSKAELDRRYDERERSRLFSNSV